MSNIIASGRVVYPFSVTPSMPALQEGSFLASPRDLGTILRPYEGEEVVITLKEGREKIVPDHVEITGLAARRGYKVVVRRSGQEAEIIEALSYEALVSVISDLYAPLTEET